jgi:hypothetical protein
MKSTYFKINPGKNPPPQNSCWLKSVYFLKAPDSHPPLSQFNRTFHKTNRLPLHLRAGLHYGGEGLRSVKNAWPRHGYMRQMVDVLEKN